MAIPKGQRRLVQAPSNVARLPTAGAGPEQEQWAELERRYPHGLTVHQILELLAERGVKLSEATFRKYVQQGLLPRSVRVGRKGRHKGSHGLYPVGTVRQLLWIRELMAQGFTIEEIQREALHVRGEIDALRRQFERVVGLLEQALGQGGEADLETLRQQVRQLRQMGEELLERLQRLEEQVVWRARVSRASP